MSSAKTKVQTAGNKDLENIFLIFGLKIDLFLSIQLKSYSVGYRSMTTIFFNKGNSVLSVLVP